MKTFIVAAINHPRTVLLILVMTLLWGISDYWKVPKESTPDVKIPIIFVELVYHGISPQDAERLLLRPVEHEVRNIEGIKEIRSTAFEGGGTVVIEFHAGFDVNKAKADVRDRVDAAKAKLPQGREEPYVGEVNLSFFPVLVVKLSGNIPKRTMYRLAQELKDAIETSVKSVLKVTVVGKREEVVDILLDPTKTQAYGLAFDEVLTNFKRNNQLVPAGVLTGEKGQFSIKIPGVLENIADIMRVPVIINGDKVVALSDVADVRRTFKDPTNFARDRGHPTIALEISKRTGENLIDTIEKVKSIVSQHQKEWPDSIKVSYSRDESTHIREMLNELQNSIILAVILVMVVMVLSLGVRSALLVGIAVPGSFLMGILVISLMGLTINIVVLFSLIFSVGMLVDGAIIVVEYADRKIVEGLSPKEAYIIASQRMAWPVISSISTILVVFFPLLYWPGVPGQFMKYMPITLLAVLTASILMALIFVPTIGALLKPVPHPQSTENILAASEHGKLEDLRGFSRWYFRLVSKAIDHPGRVLIGAVLILFLVKETHSLFGKGIEFFPNVEPDAVAVQIFARGNMSIYEKDDLVKTVEQKILDMPELKSIYSSTGVAADAATEDLIGSITLEFIDWKKRRKVDDIVNEIMERTKNLAGIKIEIVKQKAGPGATKPITIDVNSYDSTKLVPAVVKIREKLEKMPGIVAIEDSRMIPGIDWQIDIDRVQAAKYQADVVSIGNAIKLVTNGIKVGTYRPEDAQDEVDINVRYYSKYRTIDYLDDLRVRTSAGPMPVSNFVTRKAIPKIGKINRSDGHRVMSVKADVSAGVLVADKIQEIKRWIPESGIDPSVHIHFKGEEQERNEAAAFLINAFLLAIFAITIILVTQFNSFFSAALVLSAVVMSSMGVFVGLLIHRLTFGIVMGGIGVIALAGIIVSNNIILIDTFDNLKSHLQNPTREQVRDVILRTCVQRLRPVILTKLTAILGLLPIMFRLTIDFLGLEISHGAPSTEWWVLLSTCIVYGILFASSLTLFVTPAALMARANREYGVKTFTKEELYIDRLQVVLKKLISFIRPKINH